MSSKPLKPGPLTGILMTCTMLITVGCSNSSFSSGSKAVQPTTPGPDAAGPTQTEQPGGGVTPAAAASSPAVAIGNDCIATSQQSTFSCDDLGESRGGLVDYLVGVRLVLLNQRMGFYEGQAACAARGAEIYAQGDFFATKISACLSPIDYEAWRDAIQPGMIFATLTLDSIKAKFGQQITDRCLPNAANNQDVSTVQNGVPTDPRTPFYIICVARL